MYVTTGNGVYAVDAATHDVLWHKDASDCLTGMTLADGMLFFGSHDDSVYAIDATTGMLLWSRATGDQIESAPSVDNNRVFVGSSDGNVYALREKNGRVVWSHPADRSVPEGPARGAWTGSSTCPGDPIAGPGRGDRRSSTTRWTSPPAAGP